MLIIAQPKSASTSLAKTLSKISGKQCYLGIPKECYDIECEGFTEIQRYHNNMIERSPLFLQQVIQGNKKIFKEHLLPTERHFKIIKKISGNILILLRTPEHSYDSYKRLGIDNDKLLDDLKEYNYKWSQVTGKRFLIVYYDDLILNYNNTMKKIMKHLNLNGQIIPLLKAKYTGVGIKRLK